MPDAPQPPPVIRTEQDLDRPWHQDEDMVVNLLLVSTMKDRQVKWATALAIAAIPFGPLAAIPSVVLATKALSRIRTPRTKAERIDRMHARTAIVAASVFGALWTILVGGILYAAR